MGGLKPPHISTSGTYGVDFRIIRFNSGGAEFKIPYKGSTMLQLYAYNAGKATASDSGSQSRTTLSLIPVSFGLPPGSSR